MAGGMDERRSKRGRNRNRDISISDGETALFDALQTGI